MKESKADLFTFPCDAFCITTNGDINKRGLAVMGRGVALQAKQLIPGIDRLLATIMVTEGNHTFWIADFDGRAVLNLPVKNHWMERADVELIRRSLGELVIIASLHKWNVVALPRPGCGNGALDWKNVKPIVSEILDDRFVVVER